jgi:hypothetical protein
MTVTAGGIGVVGVGCAEQVHAPADIVALLSKQHELGGKSLPQRARYAYESFSSLDAGAEKIATVMSFSRGLRSQLALTTAQINLEVVIGVGRMTPEPTRCTT